MPFFDRFWWLRGLGGLILATLAMGMFFTAPFHFEATFIFALTLLLGGAGFLLYTAFPARTRKLARMRVLAGESAAMPLAATQPQISNVPALSDGPLDLIMRPTKFRKVFSWVILVVLFIIFGTAITVMGTLAVLALTTPFAISPSPEQALLIRVAFFSICLLVTLLLLFGATILFLEIWPDAQGWPKGITATTEGLCELRPWRDALLIPWQDIRLIEIALNVPDSSNVEPRTCIIYGAGQIIKWTDLTTLPVIPSAEDRVGTQARLMVDFDGLTRSEIRRRARDMLNVIAARTGLPLRTVYPELQARRLRSGA